MLPYAAGASTWSHRWIGLARHLDRRSKGNLLIACMGCGETGVQWIGADEGMSEVK